MGFVGGFVVFRHPESAFVFLSFQLNVFMKKFFLIAVGVLTIGITLFCWFMYPSWVIDDALDEISNREKNIQAYARWAKGPHFEIDPEWISSVMRNLQERKSVLRKIRAGDSNPALVNRALCVAVYLDDVRLLKVLIRKEGQPFEALKLDPSLENITPFHMAALFGSLECLEELIKRGPEDCVNLKTETGRTPLMYACSAVVGWRGETSLSKFSKTSAHRKSRAAVKLLVERGADILIRDNSGYDALSVAIDCRNFRSAEFLLDSGAPVDRIYQCQEEDKKVSASLLDFALSRGDDFNLEYWKEVVELLIAKDAVIPSDSSGSKFVPWIDLLLLRGSEDLAREFVKKYKGHGYQDLQLQCKPISSDYAIGLHEVTWDQYFIVKKGSRAKEKYKALPCEITYQAAKDFCSLLTRRERLLGNLSIDYCYVIPEESWWYRAALGSSVPLSRRAWYYSNSGGEVHPVGTKSPNENGFYDTAGNVAEWVRGSYAKGGSYESGTKACLPDAKVFIQQGGVAGLRVAKVPSLYAALINDDIHGFRQLIFAGSRVDLVFEGKTMLSWALEQEKKEFVQFLLKSGASDKDFSRVVVRESPAKGWYMGIKPISPKLYYEIMGNSSENSVSEGGSGDLKYVYCSSSDAARFCRLLTTRERMLGRIPENYHYVLPTSYRMESATNAGGSAGEPNAWGIIDLAGGELVSDHRENLDLGTEILFAALSNGTSLLRDRSVIGKLRVVLEPCEDSSKK